MGTIRKIKPPAPGLRGAVQVAVEGMTWLVPSDRALVELALNYAQRIDESPDDKTLGWLGPHLGNVLRSLGGSPSERKALGVDEIVRGKLADLRAARK